MIEDDTLQIIDGKSKISKFEISFVVNDVTQTDSQEHNESNNRKVKGWARQSSPCMHYGCFDQDTQSIRLCQPLNVYFTK